MTDICHVLLHSLFASEFQLAEDALSLLDHLFDVCHESFEIGAFGLEGREAMFFGKMLLAERGSAKEALVWLDDLKL